MRVRPRSHRSLIVVALCLAACPRGSSRAQEPPATASPFRSTATAVVVDVIVRDGRGEPVRGLTAADFQLRENDVVQTVAGVDAVGAHDSHPAAASAVRPQASATDPSTPATDVRPARPGRLVALVFDRLSADARALAFSAALSYVETSNPGDRIGVFLSDLVPETIQDYTGDRDALRRAVRIASMRATSLFDRKSQRNIDANPEIKVSDHPGISDTAGVEYAGRVAGGQDYAHKSYDQLSLIHI